DQNPATGLPTDNLLNKDVFLEITESGWQTIDISAYNIRVERPFFVSFEWLDAKVNTPTIGIKGRQADKDAFTQTTSLGKWENTGNFNWIIKATIMR
ncbi:MAG: hypothetical protein SFU27_10670, partial [Thermonemataceae bacterium]|nr:hypothetical protein [Thermonemataceae bacterium]